LAYPLILVLGVPAVVGAVLGYMLLGKSANGARNVFGQDALDDSKAVIIGALVVGVLGWLLAGLLS
jgi:hypothetical protein